MRLKRVGIYPNPPSTLAGVEVHVVLSRRNLLALLAKIDDPDSQRTIVKRDVLGTVVIEAENDEAHYQGAPAGEMGEKAEKFIAAHGGRPPLVEVS